MSLQHKINITKKNDLILPQEDINTPLTLL